MMYADLFDQVDFFERLKEIGFHVPASVDIITATGLVSDQLPSKSIESRNELASFVSELRANKGLVLPEIIELITEIKWPKTE